MPIDGTVAMILRVPETQKNALIECARDRGKTLNALGRHVFYLFLRDPEAFEAVLYMNRQDHNRRRTDPK
jgi:hypothetical protein